MPDIKDATGADTITANMGGLMIDDPEEGHAFLSLSGLGGWIDRLGGDPSRLEDVADAVLRENGLTRISDWVRADNGGEFDPTITAFGR
ncbi:hypothetical protein A5717_26190 [Mycolicibacterium porcinum]|uniref:hypothetical protein n=1 Tax=Mycolicibacterium porcinum TaxID=39693 RepID=UPI00080B3A61|nr:hypothetical protein [Mycolicibacterium porcinum]OCB09268.1 hypothetical protein A5717_26190 [Mycolicibacterium porcinum]